MVFAHGIWCVADVSSVSLSSEQTEGLTLETSATLTSYTKSSKSRQSPCTKIRFLVYSLDKLLNLFLFTSFEHGLTSNVKLFCLVRLQ